LDEDFDFEKTRRDIQAELADLNKEAIESAVKIQGEEGRLAPKATHKKYLFVGREGILIIQRLGVLSEIICCAGRPDENSLCCS
jgi:hypothetical protein